MPEDAPYIHRLRTDPANNTHLSRVNGTVADQRAWIEAYKVREMAGEELYYIIENSDGTSCGVVRLYEITRDSFTWGSWILDRNKPAKAALESAVLIYRIAFEKLGLERAVFDVRRENSRALAFHSRFGATETGQNDENCYFEYRRDRFLQDYNAHLSAITGGVGE
jgi:RimJ/RimL family protein N-acetyltransferase